ncbi:hypothetical protein QUC31_000841 [Theobroma cacao]|uniref:Uncharacterized protein LOC18592163 n=2 Tax=Theobroma cacao TaxID=3641 RepID=A0AB32UVR3_THECC|nr:PREDICTED: uncharacterized protein LOC18592163 [Theobroma cacao]EOY16011.1 E3 ubiquitin-protein ligase HUWE1, putative [Theobroma cacao]WRX31348.1 hypothetical protein QQP08_023835 [Theobroma cacao]
MVSIQAPLSPDMRKTTPDQLENSSKKRKLDEPQGDEETFEKRSKAASTKSVFDMELHLETPLPLEWQRCLDIQSGQIHFYNTRTHTRTCKDPRRSPEPPSPRHMSLDLELNLPCDSVRKTNATDHHQFDKHNSVSPRSDSVDKKINSTGGLTTQSLSWLAVEEDDQKQQEMVATVCMRCHMLVMLCKSAPACPNCKFMHPPDQGPPKLFKQRLSLLC